MATRINKYLSEVGFCSRREADRLILEGKVTINGKIPEIGTKVEDSDQVEVKGQRIEKSTRQKKIYLAFNKHVGIVCTTDGKVDGFVCSSGTGGTIAGVSSFLKEKNKDIKIYLSDPTGSSLYSYIENGELKSEGGSITEGIGSSRVTANFAKAKIDGAFSISDHESLPVLFDLIEKEGLSLGTSCGVNIAGAIRLGKLLGPGKTIVTILCDKSDKYNSKMFNKSFLQEKGLPYPHWI